MHRSRNVSIIFQLENSCPIGYTGRKVVRKMYKISLASARVNAKMTQEDVTKKMKVSKNTIVNWENGKIEMKPAQFKMYSEKKNCGKR